MAAERLQRLGQHARHCRIGAARGRDRDADLVLRASSRQAGRRVRPRRRHRAGTVRCCRPPAPRPAAAADARNADATHPRPPQAVPRVARCSAVRVTTTLGPVSSSCRFTTIRSKRRGSMRGCCTCTTRRPPPRSAAPTAAATPPQPTTRSGQRRPHRVPHRRQRRRPQRRGHPPPWRARRQHPKLRVQSRRLGQAQRLRLKPGIALAENPRRRGSRHARLFGV